MERDIINGISAIEFSPTAVDSRAEVATFVLGGAEAADIEVPASQARRDFPDLRTDYGRSTHSHSVRRSPPLEWSLGRADAPSAWNVPIPSRSLATMVVGALDFSRGDA